MTGGTPQYKIGDLVMLHDPPESQDFWNNDCQAEAEGLLYNHSMVEIARQKTLHKIKEFRYSRTYDAFVYKFEDCTWNWLEGWCMPYLNVKVTDNDLSNLLML
jgi:hypothetical protein